MIVARLFPPDSDKFKRLQGYFSSLASIIQSQDWIQLFSIWTLTVSGIVVSMDKLNRYVYWDWSGWLFGLIKLVLVSTIFFTILHPNHLWLAGKKSLDLKEISIHTGIAFCLLLFGSIDISFLSQQEVLLNIFTSLISIVPYLFAFVSCLLIFQFTIVLDEENRVWNNFEWHKKFEYMSMSIFFMFVSIIFGVWLDDPIISTAGAVSAPFAIITLIWPNHVRHLQRARFYPLFVFAMFLCARAPWFLIPLLLLFFILRTIYYFKYGIVYPSFGVDFLEED